MLIFLAVTLAVFGAIANSVATTPTRVPEEPQDCARLGTGTWGMRVGSSSDFEVQEVSGGDVARPSEWIDVRRNKKEN